MISLLIVNYRSAPLAIEAIRTARSSTSQRLHVVVVDNSCDPREAEGLRPHADVLSVDGVTVTLGVADVEVAPLGSRPLAAHVELLARSGRLLTLVGRLVRDEVQPEHRAEGFLRHPDAVLVEHPEKTGPVLAELESLPPRDLGAVIGRRLVEPVSRVRRYAHGLWTWYFGGRGHREGAASSERRQQ